MSRAAANLLDPHQINFLQPSTKKHTQAENEISGVLDGTLQATHRNSEYPQYFCRASKGSIFPFLLFFARDCCACCCCWLLDFADMLLGLVTLRANLEPDLTAVHEQRPSGCVGCVAVQGTGLLSPQVSISCADRGFVLETNTASCVGCNPRPDPAKAPAEVLGSNSYNDSS